MILQTTRSVNYPIEEILHNMPLEYKRSICKYLGIKDISDAMFVFCGDKHITFFADSRESI